ncbi:MAG TPA: hypothetical protein VMA37_00395 [Acetobacteraceae bacterium]|nr:hypothetical protein [Acetobacteraceae bacterium]
MAGERSSSLMADAPTGLLAQPILGVLGGILVVALSFASAALLPPPVVNGWVGLGLTAAVPTLIVQTTVWRGHPRTIVGQPLRGLTGVMVMTASGAGVSVAALLGFGGGDLRPTPFVIMPLVCAVPIILWQVFLFECWPFRRLSESPITIGLLTLVTSYVAVAVGVHLFFNDAFLRGAAFYDARLDPGGLFDARDIVAIAVASAGGVLGLAALDFWPVAALARLLPILNDQPGRGIAGLAFSLGAAIALWAACCLWSGADVATFQARVCVSFIFGMFVLLVMLQGSAFSGQRQPLRGLFVIGSAAMIAVVAYPLYRQVAAWRGGLASATELDTWISTVMLAITFPGMGVLADLFDFWPLRRSQ